MVYLIQPLGKQRADLTKSRRQRNITYSNFSRKRACIVPKNLEIQEVALYSRKLQ